MHHARCIRRRKCVAFAHKQRGKQSIVASQVKNSQAYGAPRSLLNNACKQLLHTQEQESGTPLWKETTLRNNKCNKPNFAMPYSELAYRTRTAMHAFTPPDTPAKRWKLAATVAGRDLPARQLQIMGIVGTILLFQADSLYPVLCPKQNPSSPAILLWQENPVCTATWPLWTESFNPTQPP